MPKKMTFEEALAKLEETVHRLEEGNLPLDEAVALFEEGTRLAALCNQQLDGAELKVKQLVQTPDGGYAQRDLALGGERDNAESGA
jgi:exodeoxyribonuclease VII small subunit